MATDLAPFAGTVGGGLVPNPINRYWIGADTPGIMYNKDGSLDIYIKPQSPGQAKQNNWLPSPTTNQPFNMVLRLYWPDQPQALNGTWSPPPIQRANATGQSIRNTVQRYGIQLILKSSPRSIIMKSCY
jgi:Protein of unknown function (DUF1214)